MKVAVLFDHFGPYHMARLRGAMARVGAVGVEFYPRSGDYAWDSTAAGDLPLRTVAEGSKTATDKADFPRQLAAVLDEEKPDAVAVPGWSSFEALTALRWCRTRGVPAVLMSESSAHDAARSPVNEWIKRRVVGCFSTALVGGTPHREYLERLGFPPGAIFLGYDAVDNAYFMRETDRLRAEGLKPPPPGRFLASARFIEKKNLARLIDAYAAYRNALAPGNDGAPWSLELLGDGELRPGLEEKLAHLQLGEAIRMPGFKQYPDLPRHYAGASAFIHASTTEQWGLVVNEAMASGLPVLVSSRCGCAPDLVANGENGFTFDPFTTEAITRAMLAVHRLTPDERAAMGRESRRRIGEWGPERFGTGLEQAAVHATARPARSPGPLPRLLLRWLTRRPGT